MSNRADNFSGTFPAPSDGGSNWVTGAGTWANSGGVLSESSGNSNSVIVLESSSNIGRVEFTTPATGISPGPRLVLRYTDASNYVYCEIDGGFAELVKRVAGTNTHLAYTGSITVANGDTYSLEVDGSDAYVLKQNGSTVAWASGTGTDAFNSTATKHGIGRTGLSAWTWDTFSFTDTGTPPAGLTVTPANIPKNHSGNIALAVLGSGTSFTGSTVLTPSGVTGLTKVSQSITDGTHAVVTVTTDATHTGTVTITESVTGSATGTLSVATATLSISPTSGLTGTTPTLTITQTNTVLTQETAAGLYSVSGGTGASVGTPTITTDTAGTVVLTVGSGAGPLTVTDNATGATATFTALDASQVWNVVVHGDSRAEGVSASDAAHKFPARLQVALGTTYFLVTNAGVSGIEVDKATGDDMRTDLAGTSAGGDPNLPALYNSSAAGNLLVFYGGFNDWNNDAVTGAQLAARKSGYVVAAVAAGWKVFECTETSSQESGWDAVKDACNVIRRATTGWKTDGAVAVIDWGRDQLLGADGAYSGADFAGGGPHLTDAGQERQAASAAAVILQYTDGGTFTGGGGGAAGSRIIGG